ncbi:Na/Pi cotransporter family protein [Nostoc sp. UCD121]|uniref:Na/Pi cotransporter family protein n=1 Tax=unclassified Nostoc TaxID=2593658 RepID=UPI0016263EAA|nr:MULTISPECIES: Na/Pi symporter [unclassified Nostoc]MBC1220970.1 Na/Pi cotransporter family protein [Nostoc sp. UCD120]MBC1280064.1 Na/Pi cotransporter family protein [Nostoc sp. UCD121]MBC1296417.1 Na/Pi cotransporter family protein [Nostoc sp. UCD122]
MLLSKSFKKVFNGFILSILVSALLVTPSILGNNFHWFHAPSLEISVNAQTPTGVEETQQRNSELSPDTRKEKKNSQDKSAESKGEEEGKLDIFKIVTGALAGLVLFLYGVTRMAEGLEAIAGDRAKELISKFTTNRYAGIATGTVATTILDSSSVTIIIVIAMVSAGLLSFVESLGVVLGSNIGTTIGAQIVAFNISDYAPIAMFVGLLLILLGKKEPWKQIGLIILGIGLLFFGLDTIENAMEPFKDYQPFIKLMETLGNNALLGAGIGALFTVLVQSSSATVAIIVTLASQGLISLSAGVALMLGAEVGTCADTLVATFGRERPAVRTGIFHLLFNLTTAAVGIVFATQLAGFAQWISQLMGAGDNVARQIANAQLIFNLLGVALIIGFLPLIARGLERLLPDKKNQNRQAESVKS